MVTPNNKDVAVNYQQLSTPAAIVVAYIDAGSSMHFESK